MEIEMENFDSKAKRKSSRRRSLLRSLGQSFASEKQSTMKLNKVEQKIVYLPANYPSCPPGLEQLIAVDHLFVRQGLRHFEPPHKLLSRSKFEVLNGMGQRIFHAQENTENILKLCCRGGCGMPFQLSIKDRHSGYEILAVNGHPDCYGAMCASISQNGMNLGFLNEDLRCCTSIYFLIDAQGNNIFRLFETRKDDEKRPLRIPNRAQSIASEYEAMKGKDNQLCENRPNTDENGQKSEGGEKNVHFKSTTSLENPCGCFAKCSNRNQPTMYIEKPVQTPKPCICPCCCTECPSHIGRNKEYNVFSFQMETVIGKMSRKWDHLYEKYPNLVDCFGVSFPREVSVRHKALILGALFLLDISF